ncbi:MAG: hypothetical protein MO846_12195 [Candidatus Devosia symbiotica]|nr:hypothetical protein [Candidatus Devosia symbiotica]
MTLDLRPIDIIKTELTLTHVKFDNEGSWDRHSKGWDIILNPMEATEI